MGQQSVRALMQWARLPRMQVICYADCPDGRHQCHFGTICLYPNGHGLANQNCAAALEVCQQSTKTSHVHMVAPCAVHGNSWRTPESPSKSVDWDRILAHILCSTRMSQPHEMSSVVFGKRVLSTSALWRCLTVVDVSLWSSLQRLP
jgi:hypothetical protein